MIESNNAANFQCPGHIEFFHHYNIYAKAKTKAQIAVDALLKTDGVRSAHYKLLEKDTPEGKESGYFNRMNNIYKYAVALAYEHENNCENCSYYQKFQKSAENKPTSEDLVSKIFGALKRLFN